MVLSSYFRSSYIIQKDINEGRINTTITVFRTLSIDLIFHWFEIVCEKPQNTYEYWREKRVKGERNDSTTAMSDWKEIAEVM